MKDDKLYRLYETLYGISFNRILLKGNIKKGFERYSIKNINEIYDNYEKIDMENEAFISVYNFDKDKEVIKWFKSDLELYEKYSIKNCIIIRFRENTDILKEETEKSTDIQKFMFIRRSINLGFDKKIINECKETASLIKNLFGLDSLAMFNGYDECLLYVYLKPIELKNAQETFYYFYTFLKKHLNLEKINYKSFDPFSQVTKLPGTQNKTSRLYVKPFDLEWDYSKIIRNSEDRLMNEISFDINQDSTKLELKLHELDDEITKNPRLNDEKLQSIFNSDN